MSSLLQILKASLNIQWLRMLEGGELGTRISANHSHVDRPESFHLELVDVCAVFTVIYPFLIVVVALSTLWAAPLP